MSDEKNLSDDLNDMLDDAKEGVKKAQGKAKEFANEAKESAREFSESANEAFNDVSGDNKKILAGVIAIIFGWIGIHKFILGYNKEGIILLILGVLGFFTCGITSAISGIVGLVEGIIYLTKTDAEFYNTYQAKKKAWF